MQCIAYFFKIFVRSKPLVDHFIIFRIVSVAAGLKNRRKINGIGSQPFDMRYPFLYFQYPMFCLIIHKSSQRKNVIKNQVLHC